MKKQANTFDPKPTTKASISSLFRGHGFDTRLVEEGVEVFLTGRKVNAQEINTIFWKYEIFLSVLGTDNGQLVLVK